MKTKFATLLALAALVVGGNAKAAVVLGISNQSPSLSAASSFNVLNFSTTSLGGAKVGSIGLHSLSSVTGATGTVTFHAAGQLTATDDVATFEVTDGTTLNGSQLILNWTNGDGSLLAGQNYNVTITGLDESEYKLAGNLYDVAAGVSNYWYPPSVGMNNAGSAAVNIYYDTTSVPEPGTMILTGAALAAGAVGAYFKRRRKAKTEVAA